MDFMRKRLCNHVIKSKKLKSIIECLQFCEEHRISNFPCESFNIKWHSNGTVDQCELNKSTSITHPSDLIDIPGYTYYELI